MPSHNEQSIWLKVSGQVSFVFLLLQSHYLFVFGPSLPSPLTASFKLSRWASGAAAGVDREWSSMGNALIRCFEGQEDHQGSRVQGGGGHYPYYQPQYYSHDPPASAAPRPHQQALGRHGVSPATPGGDALTQVQIHVRGNRNTGRSIQYSSLISFPCFPAVYVLVLTLSAVFPVWKRNLGIQIPRT